jgi:hypothetical protein
MARAAAFVGVESRIVESLLGPRIAGRSAVLGSTSSHLITKTCRFTFLMGCVSRTFGSRSQWNACYGADSDPSRGESSKPAFSPFETIATCSASACPRPEARVQDGPVDGRKRRESGRRLAM